MIKAICFSSKKRWLKDAGSDAALQEVTTKFNNWFNSQYPKPKLISITPSRVYPLVEDTRLIIIYEEQ